MAVCIICRALILYPLTNWTTTNKTNTNRTLLLFFIHPGTLKKCKRNNICTMHYISGTWWLKYSKNLFFAKESSKLKFIRRWKWFTKKYKNEDWLRRRYTMIYLWNSHWYILVKSFSYKSAGSFIYGWNGGNVKYCCYFNTVRSIGPTFRAHFLMRFLLINVGNEERFFVISNQAWGFLILVDNLGLNCLRKILKVNTLGFFVFLKFMKTTNFTCFIHLKTA